MTVRDADLVYLGRSGLEVAVPFDDIGGMVVVDPDGLRIGEVEDVVIDTRERCARLISVVSGGILGATASRALLPVEIVTKVDDRVHIDRSYTDVRGGQAAPPATATPTPQAIRSNVRAFAAAYGAFGIAPFWEARDTPGGLA